MICNGAALNLGTQALPVVRRFGGGNDWAKVVISGFGCLMPIIFLLVWLFIIFLAVSVGSIAWHYWA